MSRLYKGRDALAGDLMSWYRYVAVSLQSAFLRDLFWTARPLCVVSPDFDLAERRLGPFDSSAAHGDPD